MSTPRTGHQAKGSLETGDVAALVTECLPSIRRFAHRRLPAAARGPLETCDLVQEVALRMLSRRHDFDVRHPFAVQGYMSKAIMNLVRDEARRLTRRPPMDALPEDGEVPSAGPSPLDRVVKDDLTATYRLAMGRIKPKDQALIVARFQHAKSAQDIEREFAFPSTNAARVAVSRAVFALSREVDAITKNVGNAPAAG